MTRSVPIEKCLSDALIVFAQNGEAIRPEQGYPMRLFLPGWEGNISIKWLRRLEVSNKPYYTREETSKYTDLITKTGKARIFTFTMDAKSVITFPSGEMKLPGADFYEITGLAWSGRGDIARVAIAIPADGKGLPPGRGGYEKGKQVYETACAACHGADLKGVAGLPD